VPLRPVSELGLVDITDVPARDGAPNGMRRHSTRACRNPSQPLRSDSVNDDKTETKGERSGTAPALTRRKPDANPRASKRLAGADQPAAAAKRRSTGEATRLERQAGRRLKLANAAPPRNVTSKRGDQNGSGAADRTATTRTPKRSNRSARTPRRVTPVRQTSSASRTKGNAASREAQRTRDTQGSDHTKPASAAKIGISVLIGASLVAGGLLFVRAALQR
jgi:hypothetical protein